MTALRRAVSRRVLPVILGIWATALAWGVASATLLPGGHVYRVAREGGRLLGSPVRDGSVWIALSPTRWWWEWALDVASVACIGVVALGLAWAWLVDGRVGCAFVADHRAEEPR